MATFLSTGSSSNIKKQQKIQKYNFASCCICVRNLVSYVKGRIKIGHGGKYLGQNGGKTGWRKLHNKELHDLYSPSNIIRVIK
jgi:hypothetical protein